MSISGLNALAGADWVAPESFDLNTLESACGGERPWLSQIITFLTFGTITPPEDMPIIEVAARREPAMRLLFESARKGANRFIGLREGGPEFEEDIPAAVFDRDRIFREEDNAIELALPLDPEAFVEARNNPAPRWAYVRVYWDQLKPWLIDLGADYKDAHSTGGVSNTKKKPAVQLARKAIAAVFPGGVPTDLSAKERNERIRDWCSAEGYKTPLSNSSIGRALRSLV